MLGTTANRSTSPVSHPRSPGGTYSLIISAIDKAIGRATVMAMSAMSTEPTRIPSTPGWRGVDHTVPVKKWSLSEFLSAHQL